MEGTIKKHGEKVIERHIGSRRIEDFENYPFNILAKKVISESVYVFVGEKELNICRKRAEGASRKVKGSKKVVVKDAKHNISQDVYQIAIKELIEREF